MDHAKEVLETRLELVRRVNLQPLAEQREPGELAGLKDGPLTTLAADQHAHFKSGPLPVGLLRQGLLEAPRLPVVELQPGEGGKLNGLRPGAAAPVRWQA